MLSSQLSIYLKFGIVNPEIGAPKLPGGLLSMGTRPNKANRYHDLTMQRAAFLDSGSR